MGILDIFRRKAKEPPPTGLVAFMMQNPVWTDTNIKTLAQVGYENCMTVFACISKIAKAAGGIPWVLMKRPLSKDGRMDEYFSHPLLRLMERPNPRQGQSRFVEGMTGFYYVAGNSYVLGVGPEQSKKYRELYWLYPHEVEIMPGNNVEPVAGYKYTADQYNPQTYQPDEVLHLKAFHPTNYWYGLSPLKVAAKSIDTLNMATEWNMKLVQNEMRPSGAIKVEGQLTEAQRKSFRKEINENWAGPENVGKPLILEGAQEWMPFALNPKDADWLNSQKLTIRFVCLALGIPPELMGDAENKTYSNQQEARKALYEETILPYMDFVRDELNNWLVPRYGDRLFLDYDRDSIEALREDRAAIFDRAQQSHFLTVNEKRSMTGFDEMPGGDIIYMPISMIPMGGGTITAGEKRIARKSANPSFWTAPERKEALWNNFVLRVKAKERRFEDLAVDYMDDQKERIEKGLKGIGVLSSVEPDAILRIDDEAEEYRKKLMPWYVDTFKRAGDAGFAATKGELYSLEEKQDGYGFELTPQAEEALQQMIFNSGTKVNETTIDIIYRTYKRALQEGWTVNEFAKFVWHQIDEFKPWRAKLWARTESVKVENWGQIEGYKQSEYVEHKGWLSAFAPESRDSHIEASDQVVGLNEAFDVGGEMLQYPGDESGSPGNICNCLCSTYPVVVEIEGE